MIWAAELPVAITVSALFSALGNPLPAPLQAAATSLALVRGITFVIIPRVSLGCSPG